MGWAANLTEGQLLVAGMLSGGGVVGLIVRWLVNSPEREALAYRRGVSDESARCAEDIADLRAQLAATNARLAEQQADNALLRAGLLRLAMMADLTPAQRAELGAVLRREE